jgi:hypothetical protein
MRESDSWAGGGSDEDLFAYSPKTQTWTAVAVESKRDTVVFVAHGSDPKHIVYRSVYPHPSASDAFDWVSPTKYTLHFSQTANGKTAASADTCVKE